MKTHVRGKGNTANIFCFLVDPKCGDHFFRVGNLHHIAGKAFDLIVGEAIKLKTFPISKT